MSKTLERRAQEALPCECRYGSGGVHYRWCGSHHWGAVVATLRELREECARAAAGSPEDAAEAISKIGASISVLKVGE